MPESMLMEISKRDGCKGFGLSPCKNKAKFLHSVGLWKYKGTEEDLRLSNSIFLLYVYNRWTLLTRV